MHVAMDSQNATRLMRLLLPTIALSSMTALMFNIVLPQVSEEFHLSYAQVSWLSSGYTIIYAFGTVMYGKLADRYKLKNLLTFGIVMFAIGSLVGLFSTSYWLALAGRCLQSVGASCIPALAMVIPTRYVAPERRGQAMSMTAVGVALGSALAPVVSALIVSAGHWRWLFVPPLFLLLLLPLYRKQLKDETTRRGDERFDWLGGGLLASAVALLLMGVTSRSAGLFLAGLAALALLIARLHTAAHPFIRPALLRNRQYSRALTLTFLVHAIGISLFFLTPKLLSEVYHLSSNWIGFAMVPAAMASSLLGRKGGKLADRKGNRFLFGLASASLITCFLLLSSFAGLSPLWISAFLILGHVGQSFMGVALSHTVSHTLPKEQAGVGMGLFSMLNFLAQGMAMGVYGIAVEWETARSWNPLHLDPSSSLYSNIYLLLAVLHVGILWFFMTLLRVTQQKGED